MGWLKPTERRVLIELHRGAPMMRWNVLPRANPYDKWFFVGGEKGVGANQPMSPEQAKILAEYTSKKMGELNPGYVFEVMLTADDGHTYGTHHTEEFIEESNRSLGIVVPPKPKYRITQENFGADWMFIWEVGGRTYQARYLTPGRIQTLNKDVWPPQAENLPRGDTDYLQRLSELATHKDAWQIPGWPEAFAQNGIERPAI